MACLFGHKWNGCKCSKCGKTRNTGHSFENVLGKCLKKCSICGEDLQVAHSYVSLSGVCELQCQVCGQINELPHEVAGSACSKCGKSINDLINEYETGIAATPLNQPNACLHDCIKNIACRYKGIGDPSKLVYLCESYAKTMVAAMEDYWAFLSMMEKGQVWVVGIEKKIMASKFVSIRMPYPISRPLFESGPGQGGSGSFFTMGDRMYDVFKKKYDLYKKSPILFFEDGNTDDLIEAIAERKKEAVYDIVYNHAFSWVNQTMIT